MFKLGVSLTSHRIGGNYAGGMVPPHNLTTRRGGRRKRELDAKASARPRRI